MGFVEVGGSFTETHFTKNVRVRVRVRVSMKWVSVRYVSVNWVSLKFR